MDVLDSSLVIYLMIGTGVGCAMFLADDCGMRGERWFRVVTAVPFWPLYVPILFRAMERAGVPVAREAGDEMDAGIAQVDGELQAALGSLDGWAEGVLTREKDRLRELRSAWIAQAQRIREMDRLLAGPRPAAALAGAVVHPRVLQSEQARQRNLERCRRLRERAYDDLMGTLAWVRELVSMIHLAKFTGAPASRAEDLVAQIAAAVEGLAEISWQEELMPEAT
jgi:hypothetical protein